MISFNPKAPGLLQFFNFLRLTSLYVNAYRKHEKMKEEHKTHEPTYGWVKCVSCCDAEQRMKRYQRWSLIYLNVYDNDNKLEDVFALKMIRRAYNEAD